VQLITPSGKRVNNSSIFWESTLSSSLSQLIAASGRICAAVWKASK